MADCLIRATAAGGRIRALAATTTELTEIARRRHGTYPTATAALGRVLTGAALLGAGLKGPDSVILRVHGDGPLGGVVAEADAAGRVRGYVKNPHVDLDLNPAGKLDVGGAVPLSTGEIAEDLAHYLWVSEQTPSAVALGVLVETEGSVRAAGGYLLQTLPSASDGEREQLECNLRALGAVSHAVNAGAAAADLLGQALAGRDSQILGEQPLQFACRCSHGRVAQMLVSLGAAELEEMIRAEGGAEVRCEFCGGVYRLGGDELAELLARAK